MLDNSLGNLKLGATTKNDMQRVLGHLRQLGGATGPSAQRDKPVPRRMRYKEEPNFVFPPDGTVITPHDIQRLVAMMRQIH